jgi:hypothetical protein
MRVTLCTADGNTAEVEVALETDMSTIKLLAEIELGLMNPDSLQVSHNGSVVAGNPTLQAVGVGDHDLLMLAVPEPAAAAAAAPAVSAHSFSFEHIYKTAGDFVDTIADLMNECLLRCYSYSFNIVQANLVIRSNMYGCIIGSSSAACTSTSGSSSSPISSSSSSSSTGG